jgi:hypothetical protein
VDFTIKARPLKRPSPGSGVVRDNDAFGGSDCALLTQRYPNGSIYNTQQPAVKERKRAPTLRAKESFEIATKIAYRNSGRIGIPKAEAIDCVMVAAAPVFRVSYVVSESGIADRRIILAGYRLADLLARSVRPSSAWQSLPAGRSTLSRDLVRNRESAPAPSRGRDDR